MKMTRRRLLSGGLSIGSVLALASMGVTIPEVKAKEVIETSIEKINNKRLLDYIQKIMIDAMEQASFEPNDYITRDMVTRLINTRLVNLKNSRALYDCLVVCDETNNGPKVIDANRLSVDVYVKLNNSPTFTLMSGRFTTTISTTISPEDVV